jgi:hypothetical protein
MVVRCVMLHPGLILPHGAFVGRQITNRSDPVSRHLFALAVAVALIAWSQIGFVTAAAAQERVCLEAGSDQSVVQGRLGLLEGMGPAAFIVTVPAGLCLKGKEPADNIAQALSVQLYASTAEGYQDLYRMAGERVYVRGRVSGQKTFQQRAPMLMEVIEIATH